MKCKHISIYDSLAVLEKKQLKVQLSPVVKISAAAKKKMLMIRLTRLIYQQDTLLFWLVKI